MRMEYRTSRDTDRTPEPVADAPSTVFTFRRCERDATNAYLGSTSVDNWVAVSRW